MVEMKILSCELHILVTTIPNPRPIWAYFHYDSGLHNLIDPFRPAIYDGRT